MLFLGAWARALAVLCRDLAPAVSELLVFDCNLVFSNDYRVKEYEAKTTARMAKRKRMNFI